MDQRAPQAIRVLHRAWTLDRRTHVGPDAGVPFEYGFWSPEPYYGFLNTFKYEAEKVTCDKYTIVGHTKTWSVYNWLSHFSVESLSKEFRKSGLTIEQVYADVAGKPYDAAASEFAVIAKKAQE